MERLTKNDYGEYWLEARKEPRAIKKLGILEDIEQELGITLEVLFKALKDGIWYDYDGDKIEFSHVDLFCDEDEELSLVTDYEFIKAKNYGKTWWLECPEEELENV